METFIDSHMTIPDFIAALFDEYKIAGVAAMAELPSGRNAAYTLFTDKEDAKKCIPFFPVMPVNAAKAVSKFTGQKSPSEIIAVFLRPCELRALIELVKIKQASLDNLLIISFHCNGVFPFQDIDLPDKKKLDIYKTAAKEGKSCDGLRPVCSACTRFVPEGSDISISTAGQNSHESLVISFNSERGKDAAKALGLDLSDHSDLLPALELMGGERIRAEKELTKKIEKNLADTEGLISIFDRCISCHACSHACPICYCKNCYFESQTFEYFPESYFTRMEEKKALRLPVDRILFHLGRLSHMGLSCAGCGMCEDVCPMNIPVSQIFKTAGAKAQSVFHYTPGKDPDTPLPLLTYMENEFEEFED